MYDSASPAAQSVDARVSHHDVYVLFATVPMS